MANLYVLTENLLLLQELLENPIEGEEVLAETIEAIEGEYEWKIENYCKVIKNLEASAEACKAEADRLTKKRKTIEGNIDRLKNAMYSSMKLTGKTKVKGDLFTVAIQKNGGKLPVIVDVEVSELPDSLVKVVESPDLEAIYKLLEKGESAYAHFGERGESLRIR